jgi:CheY-like chemotaxis protein
VLLVEDESTLRRLTAEALRGAGHSVVAVGSGEEALRRFGAERFQVVITDRAMPGLSGDDVAEGVKRLGPDTPVIMLTGFGELMRSTGEVPVGVDLVLSKPIEFEDLRRAVERLARR